MSNSFFRFKKFTIYQDNCAMKVCTDSCLFGAWTVNWLKQNRTKPQNIIDIGAGTGLLSLMLAQELPFVSIDAVEIEPLCFRQAEINVVQSLWSERIKLFNEDVNLFTSQRSYEFILCNPPFYESDLASENHQKNIAHHNAGLTLQNLLEVIQKHLAEEGCFAVLLPYQRMQEFENIAYKENFFVIKKEFIKQTNRHSFFRVMSIFSREKKEGQEDEIIIKNESGTYSPAFISLLEDYYFYL